MRPRRTATVRRALGISTVAFLLTVSCAVPAVIAQEIQEGAHWVGTWAAAAVARPQPQPTDESPRGLNDQTLRQVVHTSIGGDHVRVVLSNVFGTAPLEIGAAHIALRASEAGIVPTLGAPLTFSGNRGIRIPAGAVVVTDPVSLLVPPLVDLAIDLYLPGGSSTAPSRLTLHGGARQTSYVSRSGDHTGATNLPVLTTTESWLFLARVEVTPRQPTGAIVAIGDSITDGYSSTPNLNSRWPDYLARRLMARPDGSEMGVLNAGIDGNRILSGGMGVSALARFDRDVLAQTGATHVVVLLGINDLGLTREDPRPSSADLITGHRQLIARARARGLKVIGATLLPFEGATFGEYWTAEGEATRQAFNEWMRTSGEHDGVIDFDAILRDPAHPTTLLPQYDSGDHLHPSDIGYMAMAAMIDLSLFDLEP